ncbi:hypothetical protein [Xylanimonas ulmi]|uniref:Uncharacterized protein n=1 Tax=Xylanimonas ulmi TaxID=228973 RepID=A0A4Q7LYS0_9MICO|nr:hypothetical protein [Xylanibacterium ulmi]RZS60446.1 hypothetical protein EV386_0704 [Xylanibacterium ulmi]
MTNEPAFPSIPRNSGQWLPLASEGGQACRTCGHKLPVHHVLDLSGDMRPICVCCVERYVEDNEERLQFCRFFAVADIYARLDDLFKDVDNVNERQVFLDLVSSHAEWMANWRWPEDLACKLPPAGFDGDDD